jgi:site-specific DNA recombinase
MTSVAVNGGTKVLRCAIYTRKSNDEGLEQVFNTLDAQRAACEAYIRSQASEHWVPIAEHFDDGGRSGGTMNRPAVSLLLEAIAHGRVDIVVVYKVDRLTRSLMDFARIVERFDAHKVSFVSVTQAFNTTSSMGRLTLNVLLSFAQFERDVTGERIRDKIAASKARGMWMGGNLPLGYDAIDRKLVIIDSEAELVRHIYARYLALGSVVPLVRELDASGQRTKSWVSKSGKRHGGGRFSCGAIYHILSNRLYRGEIVHKSIVHQGEHAAIIDTALFNAVAAQLQSQRVTRSARKSKAAASPLTGKLFDIAGNPMRPTFSHGRGKRIYRYYVSEALLPVGQVLHTDTASGDRISAIRIERLLAATLSPLLPAGHTHEDIFAAISRIRLQSDHLRIHLARELLIGPDDIAQDILARATDIDLGAISTDGNILLSIPNAAVRRGKTLSADQTVLGEAERSQQLLALLRQSHRVLVKLNASPLAPDQHSKMKVPNNAWSKQRMHIALLAPDIQLCILHGKTPSHVTTELLLNANLPLDWEAQRAALGMGE